MPKIIAWKCPHTAKLFEDEKLYRAHLKQLSVSRLCRKKHQLQVDNIDAVIKGEQNCSNAQELCEYVLKHSKEYMLKGMLKSFDRGPIIKAIENGHKIHWPKYTGMKIYGARWNASVSNSHSSPRSGETNWGRDKIDVSHGYPGWHGNIRIWHNADAKIVVVDPRKTRVREFSIPSFSDCVSHLSGINTGSGGGRVDGSYYDVKLFVDDFPKMAKQVTFCILNEDTSIDAIGNGRIGHVVDGDPFK